MLVQGCNLSAVGGKIFLARPSLLSTSVAVRRTVRPKFPVVLFAVVFLSFPAVAEASQPDIADPTGDVVYQPGWTGGPSDHIDILSAWYAYDPLHDTVSLTIQLQDNTRLRDPAPEWGLECEAYAAAISQGQAAGEFRFARYSTGPDTFRSVVYWYTLATGGPVWHIENSPDYLPHTVHAALGAPGTLSFTVARSDLALRGDELRGLWVSCKEWPFQYLSNVENPIRFDNYDQAKGNASLSLTSLEPAAITTGDDAWDAQWVAPAIGLAILAKLVIAWWQYARLANHKVLENPHRARLLELVDQNPGIHFREMVRKTRLAPGALSHHLGILERAKLVRSLTFFGFRRYVPAKLDARDARTQVALQAATARWIFDHVEARPGVTATELARARRIHPSSILFHVRRLVDAGVLERRRDKSGLGLYHTGRNAGTATNAQESARAKVHA